MEFVKYPSSVKALAIEINKAVDAYWGRQIKEKELRELIFFWAENEPLKLFRASDFNPTIKQRVGSKRLAVVQKILEGFQMKL